MDADTYQELKIFVGGLKQETTKEALDAHFSQFGYADSYIMMDKATGRSRGFGFVNFKSEHIMRTVLSMKHNVDGVMITCSEYQKNSGKGAASSAVIDPTANVLESAYRRGVEIGFSAYSGDWPDWPATPVIGWNKYDICSTPQAQVSPPPSQKGTWKTWMQPETISWSPESWSPESYFDAVPAIEVPQVLGNIQEQLEIVMRTLAKQGESQQGHVQARIQTQMQHLQAATQSVEQALLTMSAATSDSHLKIFVGGLSQNITKHTLDDYFNRFGVADSYIMMDKATGRSRGFGFVNFKDDATRCEVLRLQHQINGVKISCSEYQADAGAGATNGHAQPAHSRQDSSLWGAMARFMYDNGSPSHSSRMFVGGLPQSTVDEALWETFSPFGVAECEVMMDKLFSYMADFEHNVGATQ